MTDQTAEAPPAEVPGPADNNDPLTAREFRRALVWTSVVAGFVALWYLSQPILLIFGGVVFAAMLDGGTRLLGRIVPLRRGARLAIVCVLVALFIGWVFFYAGSSIAAQAEGLRIVVTNQVGRIMDWANARGIAPHGSQLQDLGKQLMGSVGQLTSWVGSALGAVSSLIVILVLGIYFASEPRLYERGIAWMMPLEKRHDFYATSDRMGKTLRRLMAGRLTGMAIEGVFTGVALAVIGVPMAPLLGILTGLLAFLPNIGAIISGTLIVLVGFSQGFGTGIGAIVVYVTVQTLDGYVILPIVARRAVDIPPALVLGAQLLFGALFGILGLALADPIVAMIKVLLEEKSENAADEAGGSPAAPPRRT